MTRAGDVIRAPGWALVLAAVALLAFDTACSDGSPRTGVCPGEACEDFDGGGVVSRGDGAMLPALDGAGPASDAASVDGSVPSLRSEADDVVACLDGFDNDSFGGADCDDSLCVDTRPCCVGEARAACCAMDAPARTLDVSACTEGPAAGCAPLTAPGMMAFGSPAPRVEAGGLVGGGDATMESGIVLFQDVEVAAARVEIELDIAAPTGCSSCLDGLRVSLASYVPGAPISGHVGLLVSGTRGDASLVVGDTIVARAALPDDASHHYILRLAPDGHVQLESDFGIDMNAVVPVVSAPLDLIVHGNAANRGPSDPPPARLEMLSLRSAVCDLPAALSRGGNVLEADARFANSARSPSIAQHPTIAGQPGRRMAFISGNSVWIAHGRADGNFGVVASAPALLDTSWAPGGVDDPSLFAVPGEPRWGLVLTARDAAGAPRVVSLAGGAGYDEQFTSTATTLLEAQEDPAGGAAFVGFDGASMFVGESSRYLVARGLRADGSTSLVLAQLVGDDWALADVCGTRGACPDLSEVGQQRSVHEPQRSRASAFDHDEVASPELFESGGVYRLYYAGRRGTRWSIGVLISTDLRTFVPAMDGSAVLGAASEGYRALGASDPALFVDGATLSVFHTGIDGIRPRIGVSRQPLR